MQQTLLLLAHLYANPDTVLLLDEPDAHLEILRQRQIYQLITEIAQIQSSQIIAANHSKVILNEGTDRDMVVTFVGKPHRKSYRDNYLLYSILFLPPIRKAVVIIVCSLCYISSLCVYLRCKRFCLLIWNT